ncbi:MAG: Crp/Fnr family transcriptional regulator [Alphaproteobacteria bacterium]|nr:Crp/Fnr family transcriptional regulator [Alphaproteobacteria bacterium]
MTWTNQVGALSQEAARRLQALPEQSVPKDAVLFRAGDAAQGFVVVLQGRIEVHLTGPSGREILLYSVEPGQSCVQTTLGLMAGEPYSGEAFAATEAKVVMIPRPVFLQLMESESAFRGFVLTALGRRMQDVTRLLEQVAFATIESRLAAALLDMAEADQVQATQAELAARIGSAREVVTRRLDAFQRAGWVETDRETVRITYRLALEQTARTA